MPPDDPVERAIEAVADRKPVDWGMLEREADTPEARDQLKSLRLVDDIAGVHEKTGEEFETVDLDQTRPSQPGPIGGGTAEAQPGETWGHYRLETSVGEGSFGRVYRAFDLDLERPVAVKILHQKFATLRMRDRLLSEGRAIAKIRDPHVVEVYGIESYGDRVGLCMEFVNGETLEAFLGRRGTLNEREAALVGLDVSRALAAVHRAGYVHRDVKARNVMRDNKGRIVLMDFGTGLQTVEGSAPANFDFAGTPLYMAPEVFARRPASIRSDVYSVGVLLFFLVTSEYPVVGRSVEELEEAHTHGRRQRLSERRPDLSMKFKRVVEGALAADPAERFQSAGALLEALETIVGGVEAPPPTIGRILVRSLLTAAGAIFGLTILGLLSSAALNVKLGRGDYAGEGARLWLVEGLRSMVAPVASLLVAVLVVALVAVVVRAIASVVPARRDGVRAHLDTLAHRLHLDEASSLACYVLLLCGAALMAAWWYFAPLLGVIVNNVPIATDGVENLALLSPAFTTYHEQYRQVFTSVSLLSVIAWIPVVRLIRQGQRLQWGWMAAGAALACLAVASLEFPYRLLVHNQFDAARWNGESCYILGQRGEDVLLFCPSLQPPRTRVVSGGGRAIEPQGVQENIFTRFSPVGSQPGQIPR